MNFKHLYSLLLLVFFLSGCSNNSIVGNFVVPEPIPSAVQETEAPEPTTTSDVSDAPTSEKITGQLEIVTGKIFQTTFSLARTNEITGLKEKGWDFDWNSTDLQRTNVYKLPLIDDNIIQYKCEMQSI